MLKRYFICVLFAGMVLLHSGCAAVLLTGASGGVAYTLTNVAYKTVSFPFERVDNAVHGALRKMGIGRIEKKTTDSGVQIAAETSDLKIYIDVEMITSKSTRICVDARKNVILKDKATATEIIEQTIKILETKNTTHSAMRK